MFYDVLGSERLIVRFVSLYAAGLLLFLAAWTVSYWLLPEGLIAGFGPLNALAGSDAATTLLSEFLIIFGVDDHVRSDIRDQFLQHSDGGTHGSNAGGGLSQRPLRDDGGYPARRGNQFDLRQSFRDLPIFLAPSAESECDSRYVFRSRLFHIAA